MWLTPKVKLKDVLTAQMIYDYALDPEREYVVEWMDARELLCSERLDLVAKLKLIDSRMKGLRLNFIDQLYAEHLKAVSSGRSMPDFEQFIDAIRAQGDPSAMTVLPVARGKILLDGAHRCAVGIHFNLKVPVIKVDVPPKSYDPDFFLKTFSDNRKVDYLVSEYCKLKENVYAVFIWPRADPGKNEEAIRKRIEAYGKIIYKKEISLNLPGLHLLMSDLYEGQDWTGTIDDRFAGVSRKAAACYASGGKIHVYFIEIDSLEAVLQLKEDIRALLGIGKHSIHNTDNMEETIRAAGLVLNENSLHFLNYGNPFAFRQCYRKMDLFRKTLDERGRSKDDAMIDSEGTLELYGFRASKDPVFHQTSAPELICDPSHHFTFRGLKFIALEHAAPQKKPAARRASIRLFRYSLKRHWRTAIHRIAAALRSKDE